MYITADCCFDDIWCYDDSGF